MEEEVICLNVKAMICRKEEQRMLNHNPLRLKPRLFETLYSKTSEDLIVDGSDNALVDNVNDISNQNWHLDSLLFITYIYHSLLIFLYVLHICCFQDHWFY